MTRCVFAVALLIWWWWGCVGVSHGDSVDVGAGSDDPKCLQISPKLTYPSSDHVKVILGPGLPRLSLNRSTQIRDSTVYVFKKGSPILTNHKVPLKTLFQGTADNDPDSLTIATIENGKINGAIFTKNRVFRLVGWNEQQYICNQPTCKMADKEKISKADWSKHYESQFEPMSINMLLVVDLEAYERLSRNIKQVKSYIAGISNVANGINQQLGKTVGFLTVVIMEEEELRLAGDTNIEILSNFQHFLKSELSFLDYDSAFLITGRDFDQNDSHGLKIQASSYVLSLCGNSPVGFIMASINDISMDGTTLAHELVHQYGAQESNISCNVMSYNLTNQQPAQRDYTRSTLKELLVQQLEVLKKCRTKWQRIHKPQDELRASNPDNKHTWSWFSLGGVVLLLLFIALLLYLKRNKNLAEGAILTRVSTASTFDDPLFHDNVLNI